MKALVVYDTKFGNTKQVAQAIGDVLAEGFEVQVIPAAEAAPLPREIDLLVVGGPTHAHGLSAPMKALLGGVERGALAGVPATAFDTRFRMPVWLSGSAAQVIAKRLRRAGCREVHPPESFFVAREGSNPPLPGELERAGAWARAVLAVLPAPTRQTARQDA
jgi:flavorubredoxin